MREFTYLQVDHICFQIGEWYLKWKDNMVNKEYVNFDKSFHCSHNLGRAKEELKMMICGDKDISELEDERFSDCDDRYQESLSVLGGAEDVNTNNGSS